MTARTTARIPAVNLRPGIQPDTLRPETIRLVSSYRPKAHRRVTLCRLTHDEFAVVWGMVANDPGKAHALNFIPVPPGDLFVCMGARGSQVIACRMAAFIQSNFIDLVESRLEERL